MCIFYISKKRLVSSDISLFYVLFEYKFREGKVCLTNPFPHFIYKESSFLLNENLSCENTCVIGLKFILNSLRGN